MKNAIQIVIILAITFIVTASLIFRGSSRAPQPQNKPSCISTTRYTIVNAPYFYMNGILFHGWHREEVFA